MTLREIEYIEHLQHKQTLFQCVMLLRQREEYAAAIILLEQLIEMELDDGNEDHVDDDYEAFKRLMRDDRERLRNDLRNLRKNGNKGGA